MLKNAAPAAWHAVGGGDESLVGDSVSDITPLPTAPVGTIADLLAAERTRNVVLSPPEQVNRARELLEAAGLGHLRPDKAWRPRSWQDRLATIPYPQDELLEKLAEAIYATHWRAPAPEWTGAREPHKDWSRAQARAALACLRSIERGSK